MRQPFCFALKSENYVFKSSLLFSDLSCDKYT